MSLPSYLTEYYDNTRRGNFHTPAEQDQAATLMFNTLTRLAENIPTDQPRDTVKANLRKIGQILSIPAPDQSNHLTGTRQEEPMDAKELFFHFSFISGNFIGLLSNLIGDAPAKQKNSLKQAQRRLIHNTNLV